MKRKIPQYKKTYRINSDGSRSYYKKKYTKRARKQAPRGGW